jgi:hypothetical protein
MSTLHQKALLAILPTGFLYKIDEIEPVNESGHQFTALFKIKDISDENQVKV